MKSTKYEVLAYEWEIRCISIDIWKNYFIKRISWKVNMAYKESRYNKEVKNGKSYITYNSLSGKIAVGDTSISSLIKENQMPKKIIEEGFVVVDNYEEEKAAIEKYYRFQYESTLNAILIVTKSCNFRCVYCYEEHTFEKSVLFENFTKYLRKHLANYTGLQVSWFGGEPLLCYEDIIHYSKIWHSWCKKTMRTYHASITTNGYLLTLERFQTLLNVGINDFQITIDGLKKTHDKLRTLINGQGTFDRILYNLRQIRDNCKKRFRIIVRVNISKEILGGLNEIIDLLWNEFGMDKRFAFIFLPIKNWGGDCKEKLAGELLKSDDAALMFQKMLSNNHILNYRPYYHMLVNALCFASQKNSFVMNPNAELQKCTILDKKICFGRINENGIMEKLTDDPFSKIIELNLKCQKCTSLANCFGYACPAATMYQSKNKCPSTLKNLDSLLPLLLEVDKQYKLDFLHYKKGTE